MDVRLSYARLLVTDKKYAEARGEFQSLLKEFPDNADVTMAVALLSLQLNDFDAAETQLKHALETDYKDPDAVRFYLGQVNEERKRPDDALRWYSSVTGGDQYVPSRARYAGILAKQGKLGDARKYLQQAGRNGPERVQFTQAEAQLLRDANDYRAAFDVLGQAVAKNPDSAELLYDQAMAAEKVDRIDVLETNLRKVIQLKPEYAHAYNALGYTLADRNTAAATRRVYAGRASAEARARRPVHHGQHGVGALPHEPERSGDHVPQARVRDPARRGNRGAPGRSVVGGGTPGRSEEGVGVGVEGQSRQRTAVVHGQKVFAVIPALPRRAVRIT